MALVGCPNSPLQDIITGEATTYLGPESLKDVPAGAIFTTPNFPQTIKQDYLEALDLARRSCSFISYVWMWPDGEQGLVNATQVSETARQQGLDMLLQFAPQAFGDVSPPPDAEAASFKDADLQERFINDAVKLASLQPKWLVLATEIDLLLRSDPSEYEAFTALYQRAYPRVKAVAPHTMVGVSYHWGVMFADRSFWAVDQMGPQDFIGFTSYPDFLVLDGIYPYTRPNDIPVDYYSVMREAFPDQPIAFTELGWTTLDDPEMSMQAEYLARLPAFLQQVRPIFCCWAMLYDVTAFDARSISDKQAAAIQQRFGIDPTVLFERLNHMALCQDTGEPKPALSTFWDVFGVVDRSGQ